MNKKILAILIVLIFALSISTVSATDNSSAVGVEADKGPGSFTDLQNIIKEAAEGSTVNLTKNYTYSSEPDKDIRTINIDKNLTIDGKCHTIDASNKASVFTIAEGKGVSIINITFINGNSTIGGAINNNGNLEVVYCYFINNSAVVGGAINNNLTLAVDGCEFINNSAANGGGINNNCNLAVGFYNDCYFINNSAVVGGAINNNNTKEQVILGYASKCYFINNSAVVGGAINNNNAEKLVCVVYKGVCYFVNNSAVVGGAIYNNNSEQVILSFYNKCYFINNTADGDGGAIYNNNGSLTTLNGICYFVNNSAANGGAIYNNNGENELITINSICYFINNSAVVGGAIYNNILSDNTNYRFAVQNNLYFTSNSAVNGGAIYNNKGYFISFNSRYQFTDNVAANMGGAIYNSGMLTVTGGIDEVTHADSDTSFTNNVAANMGGAIYNDGELRITRSNFTNNKAPYGADIALFVMDKNIDVPQGTAITLMPSIAIDPIDKIAVGDKITVSGNITNVANDTKITITVNEKEYNATVKDGKFSKEIEGIAQEGTAKIAVFYAGNDTVPAAEDTIDVTVGRDSSIIALDDITAIVGENVTVSGTIIPKVANITIAANGKTFNVTVSDGTFSLDIGNFTKAGNHTILVKYDGNENYTASTWSINVTVVKKATAINISDINGTAGDIVVSGTVEGVPEGAVINIAVGTVKVNATVRGSKFSAAVKNLAAGNYTVKADYAGNDDYAPSNAAAKLSLTQIATSITMDDLNILPGQNAIIAGIVTGIIDKAVIKVNVAGKSYDAIVNGSKFSVTVEGLALGSYKVAAVYEGNITYKAASASATVNVFKLPTETVIVDITDVLEAGDRLLIDATVASEDKPVNGTVELFINGKAIANAKAVNGKVSFNVTPYAGKLTVMVKFAGDNKYEESNATRDITVKGIDADLTVPDVTLFFKNGTQLMIYLTSNGADVSDEKVTININGKNYTRTVVNGTAKFDINLAPGTYAVTVSLFSEKYNFVSTNATVTVLPVIEGDDTVLFFRNGTKYVALFLDGEGRPLAGASVQFNINGVLYDRTTNADGSAGLTINLAPGTYKITATNLGNGAVNANNITVLPVIEGDDTVLFFRNGTKYVALFLDGEGRPLAGASVQFNINGVLYDRTTNADGSAGLTINLAPGKYTITAVNNGNGAVHANNITVLPTVISENVVKYYKNETQYIVKVLDGKGNALANQTVEYNINGVFYKRTTDADGVAVFKINLASGNSEPQDYIITAKCNDCVVSNTVTVLPVLIAEDFIEPFESGKKFTAKIVDGKGKPLAGAKMQFNINGVFYNRTSNVDGTAGLTINLAPGEYIITSTCNDNGAVISNKVIVMPKV